MRSFILSDFGGGVGADLPAMTDGRVAQILDGWWRYAGRLQSMEGRNLLSGTGPASIISHKIYHDASGVSYVVADDGARVWLGWLYSESTVEAASAGATTIRCDDVKLPHAGSFLINGHTLVSYTDKVVSGDHWHLTGCSGAPAIAIGDRQEWIYWTPLIEQGNVRIAQAGAILYAKSPTTGLWRWNSADLTPAPAATRSYGIYSNGWASANGTDPEITLSVTAEQLGGVPMQGDSIYMKNVNTGVWFGPYVIITVVATAAIVLTLASVPLVTTGYGTASSPNTGEYMIARTCRAGLPAGSTTTAVEEAIVDPVIETVVDDCATVWDSAGTISGVTTTAVDLGLGKWAAKHVLGSTFVSGPMGWNAITETDMATYTHAHFWVYSKYGYGAGAMRFALDSSLTFANSEGIDHRSVSIPQLEMSAGWQDVSIELTPDQRAMGAVKSFGIIGVSASMPAGDPFFYIAHVRFTDQGTVYEGEKLYCWRYGSSKTRYTGDLSEASEALFQNREKGAVVAGWDVDIASVSGENHIDQVEIYVSGDDGISWTLVTTLTADADTYLLPTNYTDLHPTSRAVVALGADAPYHARDAVFDGGPLFFWNERLYRGYGPWKQLSTLGFYEYWPDSGVGNFGGWVLVGDSLGDAVMEFIPEGSAYDTSGRTGSNLLVLTRTQAKRWYGMTWADFYLESSFGTGCCATGTGANRAGWLFWLSNKGPVKLASGSHTPEPIYARLWPGGIDRAIAVADLNAELALWCAAVWGEWYVLGGYDGSAYKLYCYHVPTDAWETVTLSERPRSLAAWNGPNDQGELTVSHPSATGIVRMLALSGRRDLAATSRSTLWTRNAGETAATGQVVNYTSARLSLANDASEISKLKQVLGIAIGYKKPSAAQTLVVSLFADGDRDHAIDTVSLTLAQSNGAGDRGIARWSDVGRIDNGTATSIQIKLSGVMTRITEIEWVRIDYKMVGE